MYPRFRCSITPFADPSEINSYSLISSYGGKLFPKLSFQAADAASSTLYADFKPFINQLVVANPDLRLSVTSDSEFAKFKSSSPLFKAVPWENLGDEPSPLARIASSELHKVNANPIHKSVIDKFNLPFRSDDNWEMFN